MSNTIFDKIINGEIKSWIIWEDDSYIAFLTPLGNTPAATVVIPKVNQGVFVYDLSDEDAANLMIAANKVSKLLKDTYNTEIAMIFEGTAVPYVHAKLYPMHGLKELKEKMEGKEPTFNEKYIGYVTSQTGPLMDEDELDRIQKEILENANK